MEEQRPLTLRSLRKWASHGCLLEESPASMRGRLLLLLPGPPGQIQEADQALQPVPRRHIQSCGSECGACSAADKALECIQNAFPLPVTEMELTTRVQRCWPDALCLDSRACSELKRFRKMRKDRTYLILRLVAPLCLCVFNSAIKCQGTSCAVPTQWLTGGCLLSSWQEGTVNEKQIGKLADYAAENPDRIPLIVSKLEERGAKDAHAGKAGSTVPAVVRCFSKLTAECGDHM